MTGKNTVFGVGVFSYKNTLQCFKNLANIVTRKFYSSLFPDEIHIEYLLGFSLNMCLVFHNTHQRGKKKLKRIKKRFNYVENSSFIVSEEE